jgi:integrase
LASWAWLARGEQPPTGRARRGAVPPALPLAALIVALLALKVGLREKVLWRMLYDTCARAEEILSLDLQR